MPRRLNEVRRETDYPGVYWIESNEYVVRGTWMDGRTGKERQFERRVEAKNDQEAAQQRFEILAQLRAQTASVETQQDASVKSSCKSWLKLAAPTVSKGTAQWYANALAHVLAPYRDADGRLQCLGDLGRASVATEDMQAWVNYWVAAPAKREPKARRVETDDQRKRDRRPYANDTVHGWVRVLRFVIRDQQWPVDPTKRLRFADQAPRRAKTSLLPEQQQAALLELEKIDAHDFAFLAMKAKTGQRWSHVAALKVEDIDWQRREIHFRRRFTRNEVGPISRKKPAPETFPVDQETIDILQEQRQRLVAEQHPGLEDGWLFPSSVGRPRHPTSIYDNWRTALEAAGIGFWVSPHGIRRSACDGLRRIGAARETRQALIGHHDDRVHDEYQRVQPDELRTVSEQYGRTISLRPRKAETGGSTADRTADRQAENTKAG